MSKERKWRTNYQEVRFDEWQDQWSILDYPDDFWKWVNSINTSFQKMVYLRPFERYVMQAHYWLHNDRTTIYNYQSREDQIAYIEREKIRSANTLYFANKYGWLKDGNAPTGEVKFDAFPAQEVVFYLLDLYISMLIAKGRQIGMTSALSISGIKEVNIRKNYFLKYIACDKEKTLEIFNDKFKDGFSIFASHYPWFASSFLADAKNEIKTGVKTEKGRVKGRNSRILVDTPSKNAINGGSPQRSMIDEIGLIDNGSFSPMLNEGRPTLYMFNPENGKLELRRQVIGWGTGGDMEKGGGAMEVEFRAALEAWKDKDYSHAMIPLFFDWTARPGATKENYEAEKRFYYRKAEKEKDPNQIIQFHQAWPSSIDDVFMRNSKTLVDREVIVSNIDIVLELMSRDEIQFGYFEPIYDTANKYHENFIVPHPIVGARFVPTQDLADPRTTAFISRKPARWKHRYFQGIDPINSETGKSKFASTIWDKHLGEVSSGVFYRERRYQNCYIQALLQKIYYGHTHGRGVMTLIENNIGDDLYNTWDSLGWSVDIIANIALPHHFRSRGSGTTMKWWGISNRTNTAGNIIGATVDLLQAYPKGIRNLWFWHNMKTFVEKELNQSQTHRETRWQAQNKDIDFDDQIFSTTFSYIAADSEMRNPTDLERQVANKAKKKKLKYVFVDGQYVLRHVDEKRGVSVSPSELDF